MTRSDPGRPDRRSDARERALYLLYEATQKAVSVDEVLAAQVVPADDLTTLLVTGVAAHRERLDAAIAARAEGWPLARMPLLDLDVLRLGAFELAERPDVPVAVVIDEAVELAKRFSTDNSGRFVNGVLAALAAELRPDSAAEPPDSVAELRPDSAAESPGQRGGATPGETGGGVSSSEGVAGISEAPERARVELACPAGRRVGVGAPARVDDLPDTRARRGRVLRHPVRHARRAQPSRVRHLGLRHGDLRPGDLAGVAGRPDVHDRARPRRVGSPLQPDPLRLRSVLLARRRSGAVLRRAERRDRPRRAARVPHRQAPLRPSRRRAAVRRDLPGVHAGAVHRLGELPSRGALDHPVPVRVVLRRDAAMALVLRVA